MRSTFAMLDSVVYRLKAAASLLGISENTLRTYLQQSGIEVRRQNESNPDAPAIRIFDLQSIFALAAWRRAQGFVKPVADRPIIITVDIIKGGTGKSTSTAEVAIQLQLGGYRVLVIDIDIQANLTQLLGYEADLSMDEAETYGVSPEAIVEHNFSQICIPFIEKRKQRVQTLPDVSNVIKRPFGANGPALIPADTFLVDLEEGLTNAPGNREQVFKELFKKSREGAIPGFNINEYDFILFDCPPSVSLASSNAIATADYVIAPVRMDAFGVKGMSRLVQEINGLTERSEDPPPHLVILPTHYSPNLQRIGRMHEKLRDHQANLYPNAISSSEMFPKSLEAYLPLTLQAPTSEPVSQYRMFTEFLLKKISDDVARAPKLKAA